MTTRKFYRTVFQIEVLSEDEPYPSDTNLGILNSSITDGDCSGEIRCIGTEELNGKQAAEALIAQRSDPGFFLIDEEGNDLED